MKSYGDVEEALDGAGQPVSCCCDLGANIVSGDSSWMTLSKLSVCLGSGFLDVGRVAHCVYVCPLLSRTRVESETWEHLLQSKNTYTAVVKWKSVQGPVHEECPPRPARSTRYCSGYRLTSFSPQPPQRS
ncbi:Alpha-(1,6)-Fucosyltransferase [Manis pentadactyla]|nr:Alpha-(1,6)-Fucosyltransferase [Manis pentadactyla]